MARRKLLTAEELEAEGFSIVFQGRYAQKGPSARSPAQRLRPITVLEAFSGQIMLAHHPRKTVPVDMQEGSGLGLSIATRIVEEHGGRLDLVSKEGEGATFIITLPVMEKNLE